MIFIKVKMRIGRIGDDSFANKQIRSSISVNIAEKGHTERYVNILIGIGDPVKCRGISISNILIIADKRTAIDQKQVMIQIAINISCGMSSCVSNIQRQVIFRDQLPLGISGRANILIEKNIAWAIREPRALPPHQQIIIPISVQIGKLRRSVSAHVDASIIVGYKGEVVLLCGAVVAVEVEAAIFVANEQVLVPIAINIHEIRTGAPRDRNTGKIR